METASNSHPAQVPVAFAQDPLRFLTARGTEPPSTAALVSLAGPLASWFSTSQATDTVAAAYLRAAGIHLKEPDASQPRPQAQVLTAVGFCAKICRNRRQDIASSGILPTLADLMLQTPSTLTAAAVEFLQCALLAEHYRYAARLVEDIWPRPEAANTSVKDVLRYFYLRGLIHLGSNDLTLAHRCFWTCLCIPAEATSKIMVEAWKKLVLVQCLLSDGTQDRIRLPKAIPNCLTRLLNTQNEYSVSATTTKQADSIFSVWAADERTATRPFSTGTSGKKNDLACYMDIGSAFFKRDRATVESLLQLHHPTLAADGNVGLVQQCLTQVWTNQVRHIAKIYSVIGMAKLGELLGMASSTPMEISKVLLQAGVPCDMQDDGMIVFPEGRGLPTAPMVDMSEWMTLLEQVQRLDVQIVTSPKYHSLTKTMAKSEGPRGVEDV